MSDFYLNSHRFGAVGAWEPDDLAGIAVWLRADDVAGADASQVTTWTDRIGAFQFTQATSSKKPTYYSSTSAHLINGQPTVYFDGVDDLLRVASIISPSSGHVIVVGQIVSLPATGANPETIFCSCDEAGPVRTWINRLTRPESDTNIAVSQRENDTTDVVQATTTALSVGTVYALEWSSDSSAYGFRVNGTSQSKSATSGSDTGDWMADTTLRDSMAIGCTKFTSEIQFSNIDIAEIIVVSNSSISAGDRTSLNSYLNTRYGITMS